MGQADVRLVQAEQSTKCGFRKIEVPTEVGVVMVVQDQLSGVTVGYHGARHCRRLHTVSCAPTTSAEDLASHMQHVLDTVCADEARYLATFKEAQQPLGKEKPAKRLTVLRRKLTGRKISPKPCRRIQFAEQVTVRLYRTTTWERFS